MLFYIVLKYYLSEKGSDNDKFDLKIGSPCDYICDMFVLI